MKLDVELVLRYVCSDLDLGHRIRQYVADFFPFGIRKLGINTGPWTGSVSELTSSALKNTHSGISHTLMCDSSGTFSRSGSLIAIAAC